MYKTLKWVRRVVAAIFFIVFTLSFSFLGKELGQIPQLLNFQFVPSLLAFTGGGIVILAIFLLITLFIGRAYCSFFCPLGIMQDIISRIARLFKSKKAKHTKYSKPQNTIRYIFAGAFFLTVILGFNYYALLIDPYSNYGRIVTQLFDPLLRLINNGIALIFPNYIFVQHLNPIIFGLFFYTAAFFTVVAGMSAFRSRLFCNTVCPVGTTLGLISRSSIYRLSIDESKCVGCNLCSKNCKSECIDGKNRTIDSSRCVLCFDCTTVCKGGAIHLSPRYTKKKSTEEDKTISSGRRDALATLAAVGALVVARELPKKDQSSSDKAIAAEEITGIIPPGGVSLEHLLDHCTSCHACVAACPSKIIRPSTGEYGIKGLFHPVIHYDKGYCRYNCTHCSDACPNGALEPITLIQKQRTQIGIVQFTAKNCIVFKEEIDCGACSEHCPTQAISMKEWKGKDGLRFPSVNPEICIGCGGCESICPMTPKAMKITPLSVHSTALEPKGNQEDENRKEDIGFGF